MMNFNVFTVGGKMFFLICWVKCLDLNVVLIVFSSETGVRVLKLGHLNESDGA